MGFGVGVGVGFGVGVGVGFGVGVGVGFGVGVGVGFGVGVAFIVSSGTSVSIVSVSAAFVVALGVTVDASLLAVPAAVGSAVAACASLNELPFPNKPKRARSTTTPTKAAAVIPKNRPVFFFSLFLENAAAVSAFIFSGVSGMGADGVLCSISDVL